MGLIDKFKGITEAKESDESKRSDTRKAVIEGEYDPTKPKRINGKEWWIERIDEVSGELETYAGEWPRAMIENAVYKPRQPLWFGCSERTGREFGAEFDRLFEHVAYLGSTGAGKTTAVHNSVTQLIMAGHGVGIVDPKGDDVIDLLRKIPKRRWDDVVYVDIEADHWTLEDPDSETGEEVPYHIGFNILETYHDPDEPGYDEEVEWIVSNFMKIAGIRESWSLARRVLKTIVRWMTRQPEEYTVIEVFYALLSEDNRQQFSHLLGQHVDDDDILFIESYLREITDNMSSDQLDPLIGELKDWVEEPMTRKIVAQRDAGITLGEIVNEQKILIVNNDLPKELREQMATAIMAGIWSAVTGRRDPTEAEMMKQAGVEIDDDSTYAPFFLSIDECHAVFSGDDNIDSMLMEARSKKLGLLLSTQTLRSLPDQAAHAMVSNCNTVLSMEPGDPKEASLIADKFGDVDPAELQRTPKFHALTQMNSEDDPFLAKMLPPYPPRHSIAETHELLLTSLGNYGTPSRTGRELLEDIHFDIGMSDVLGGIPTDPDGEKRDDTSDEEKRRVIKSVYDAAIRQDSDAIDQPELEGFVPIEDVVDWVAEEWTLSRERASHIIEVLTTTNYLEVGRSDSAGVVVTPTTDALETLGLDSGKGQTGGGAEHRSWLLPRAYETLTKAGYSVEIPEQGTDDGELPDAVAEPVMDLSLPDDVSTIREQEAALMELREALESQYPLVSQLSDGDTLYVEAESKGLTKPAGPLKNLSKADGPVLFVVAEDGADGLENARKCANIVTDPTSSRAPSDVDARLYTRGDLSAVGDQEDVRSGAWFVAAPDGVAKTEWVRFDERIVLRDRETRDIIVEFAGPDAFAKRTPADFPVRYRYDDDSEIFVVRDDSGASEETTRRKYASREALTTQETTVKAPTVPELAFPDPVVYGRDWFIAVVPNDGSGLLLYSLDEDEAVPMLEQDVSFVPVKSDSESNSDFEDGTDITDATNVSGDTTSQNEDGNKTETEIEIENAEDPDEDEDADNEDSEPSVYDRLKEYGIE